MSRLSVEEIQAIMEKYKDVPMVNPDKQNCSNCILKFILWHFSSTSHIPPHTSVRLCRVFQAA